MSIPWLPPKKSSFHRRWCVAAFAIAFMVCPSICVAQARALVNTSSESVALSNVPGQDIVLGSVSLGKQRAFTMFNIQAAGTIIPDPDLNGAAFQLEFLVCDQPDCTGDLRTDTRILQNAESGAPAQVIATRSFGVTTHSAGQVTMPELPPRNSNGSFYLAVALKTLRNSGSAQFRGKLNLLRVDVLP
jgi:hypothetical protein